MATKSKFGGTFVNSFCQFWSQYNNNEASIVIGEKVSIAMNVTLCTHTHMIGSSEYRASMPTIYKPIKIKNGCWIGANVFIGPGVTIEEGCVIAAGAVVMEDCKANSMYAGVPARHIRHLDE